MMDILYMRSGCAQPCEFPEHGPEAGRVARWPHRLSLFNPRQLKGSWEGKAPSHLRSHGIASNPWTVRRAVWKGGDWAVCREVPVESRRQGGRVGIVSGEQCSDPSCFRSEGRSVLV